MYNNDRKEKFLAEMTGYAAIGNTIFNATEPYETNADKDLCELPLDTLQIILNSKLGRRVRSTEMYIYCIRAYVKWCGNNGFQTSDDIYSIQIQMDEKIRRCMVASPRHLQSTLDKMFRPAERGTIDNLYRCFLWMLFAGMKPDDALGVKVSEVNLATMLIEHGGKSYEIYKEAIPTFNSACYATEFVFESISRTGNKFSKIRKRFAGDNLMRGIRVDNIQYETIKYVMRRAFSSIDMQYAPNMLSLSGLFYNAYEAERMGDPVNFDDAVAAHIEETGGVDLDVKMRRRLSLATMNAIMDDYAAWKAVFCMSK